MTMTQPHISAGRAHSPGFTLVELLVVLAIVSLLLTLAVPRYFHSIDVARENVLSANLVTLRDTIDKFFQDTGAYPDTLEELVDKRYLRAMPVDPVTNSTTTWVIIPPADTGLGRVYDVQSGAPGEHNKLARGVH